MRKFEVVKPEHRKHAFDPVLPYRSSAGSAGYDLCSCETIALYPGDRHLFWLDVKAAMEERDVLMIYPRSSLGLKGFRLANTTGVIDSSYYGNMANDGNIGVCLIYDPPEGSPKFVVHAGDRIAQAVFLSYAVTDGDENDKDITQRTGGFGSSGIGSEEKKPALLLPCKRCNDAPVIRSEHYVEKDANGNILVERSYHNVICKNCMWTGKDYSSEHEAVRTWNEGR